MSADIVYRLFLIGEYFGLQGFSISLEESEISLLSQHRVSHIHSVFTYSNLPRNVRIGKHKVRGRFCLFNFVGKVEDKTDCFYMEKTENKELTSSRDLLKERVLKDYPETDFDAENAQDDLDDKVVAMLKKYDEEIEGYRSNDKKMRELFNKDPRGGRLLLGMASGADPITYLLDIFGPDIMDAMQSEEGKAKIAESHAKWAERKAAEEAGESTRMANFEQSITDLVAFADEKGMSDEEAIGMLERLNQLSEDALEGKYSRDSFDMVYKAMSYDGDIEKARSEGERDGRNAKIEERLATVNKAPEMPPSLNGQGGAVAEPTPKKTGDPMLEAMRERIRRGNTKRGTFGN